MNRFDALIRRDGDPSWPAILWVFVILLVIARVLVVAAEMVPDRLVANRLLEAIDSGAIKEEDYPVTGLGNRVDRWSECIALTIGLGDPPTSNNLQTAFTSPSLGRCVTAMPRLLEYRESGVLDAQRFYFRYWHGYAVLSRPAVAAIGVEGARNLAMALSLVGVAVAVTSVARSASAAVGLGLAAPFLLTTDFFDLGESLPHAVVVATTWLLAAGVWRHLANPPPNHRLILLGVVTGAVASFFEFLYLIPGTLALLTAVIAIRCWKHGRRSRELWVNTLSFAMAWFLSFAATWASKWLMAVPFIGLEEVITDIREQMFNRIAGSSDLVEGVLGAAIQANLLAWLDHPLAPTVVPMVGIAIVVSGLVVVSRRAAGLDYLALLVLIAAIPLVWYEVLSNHSQIHAWFTHRALAISLGVLLAGILAALPTAPGQADSNRGGRVEDGVS